MKYFIYYNNGHFEAVDKINMTFLHLVGIGVIKIFVDIEKAEAYVAKGDGTFEKVTVTQNSGLS